MTDDPLMNPSPPPAEDLAKLSEAVWGLLREWDTAPELPESLERRLASFEDAWSLFEEAHRPSASLPPAEDLAGQGEPVAWAYEYEASDGWQRALWWVDPSKISDGRKRVIRNIRPLFAAPAPSRPADRGLTEDDLVLLMAREWLNASDGDGSMIESVGEFAMWSPEDHAACQKVAAKILERLALRNAPRNGGDGWRPIETAPKDGTPILVYRDNGCGSDYYAVWWSETDREYPWHSESLMGYPAERFDGWKPIDAPPSPNAGDGTQDTQGGRR